MVTESFEDLGGAHDVTEEHGRENAIPELLGRQPEGVSARKLNRLPWLVAEYVDVMSGRNFITFARADNESRAVIHGYFERAGHRVADVSVLARGCAHNWRDVF
jgi:hypothetical protein